MPACHPDWSDFVNSYAKPSPLVPLIRLPIHPLATVLLTLSSAMAVAQDMPQYGTLSFVLENDVFYSADGHYTNGVRFAWVPDRDRVVPAWAQQIAEWMPWFPRGATVRHGYAFGQSMFTPRDITLKNPPKGERPYAGWLYASVGMGVETDDLLDQFGVTFGVVGPASLGEQTQKFVHRNIGSPRPEGWDAQLHNEPGLVLSWKRTYRDVYASRLLGQELDLAVHHGVTLGNVFTHGRAGFMFRFGPNLPRDYGPPRIEPAMPSASDFYATTGFRWYLFAGVEGRAVARNIFLDGNSFRDSVSVKKRHLVGDFQAGLVMDWDNWRFSYTHVARSREFRSQDESDVFGAFALMRRF